MNDPFGEEDEKQPKLPDPQLPGDVPAAPGPDLTPGRTRDVDPPPGTDEPLGEPPD
ncbi:hypothetical protein ACFWY9_23825 [Amycolatopsis sp. NPDC059027]|uniref:hypothetical protein n=1 Tax=unclassified Amycolatopsis TaxID=2618356 RepID=UPI00366B4852